MRNDTLIKNTKTCDFVIFVCQQTLAHPHPLNLPYGGFPLGNKCRMTRVDKTQV